MAAVCTEASVMVITDVPELKRPWLKQNHSNVSQITGVGLMNSQKRPPVCDTGLGSLRTVILICWEDSTPSQMKNINFRP